MTISVMEQLPYLQPLSLPLDSYSLSVNHDIVIKNSSISCAISMLMYLKIWTSIWSSTTIQRTSTRRSEDG
jgi:hypothetical protein